MKVIIYKLQGVTARKIVCRMGFFTFTVGRSAKFPTGIMDYQHSSHTGGKKIQLRQTVEEVSSKIRLCLPTKLFPLTLYMC